MALGGAEPIVSKEELRARQWLEDKEGYTDILDLSKDDQDPPDFVVENRIAVEVRRLDRGSDSDYHTLKKIIKEVLAQAGETPDGPTVYVNCDRKGVLLKTRKDRRKVKQLVAQRVAQYVEQINNALESNERPETWKTEWECGIRLEFYPIRDSDTGKFKRGAVQPDGDSGVLVVGDLIDNINRCFTEKRDLESIQKKMHCYPKWKWWLVLVDGLVMMPPGLNQDERQQIRDNLVDTCPWSRIVVLSQMDPMIQFDVIEQSTQD